MEENSPLRFLDYDVSQMIYEKYYPSIRSKQWKNMVNDQFKYHLRNCAGVPIVTLLSGTNLNNSFL